MELAEMIRSRRSIGKFTDDPVSLDLVRELLESAVYAPNHRLTEPWRFVIAAHGAREKYAAIRRDMVLGFMKDKGEAERQQAAAGTFQKFMNVPVYLFVIMPTSGDQELDDENYAACCCLIENFLLLAWERGLGTTWKTFKNDPRLRTLIGLGENERVVGIVHIGYSAEDERVGVRKPAHERLTILE
ncbi:MAG TPA: nitroreductase [Phototrophicaceae bacterium]|nr:nitroreductase [Phototrophicaceae bacterium]